MTTLKEFYAIINGKKTLVGKVLTNNFTQDIAYYFNGKLVAFDKFWSMQPKIMAN